MLYNTTSCDNSCTVHACIHVQVHVQCTFNYSCTCTCTCNYSCTCTCTCTHTSTCTVHMYSTCTCTCTVHLHIHVHVHVGVVSLLTLARTLALPMMITPYLARVRATLRRRASFRNPMPWCSLALTQERMMKSFSLPWKASTLATSSS